MPGNKSNFIKFIAGRIEITYFNNILYLIKQKFTWNDLIKIKKYARFINSGKIHNFR